MNKYEVDAFMQEIFSDCETIDNACKRYVYAKDKLEGAFKEKLGTLISSDEKGSAE